jgi:fermentation-respiration switch protein FrsA (DUF1100 family)
MLRLVGWLTLLGGLLFLLVSWRTARDHAAPVRFAAPALPPGYEAVSFRTSDGLTLHGWFAEVPDAQATAILLHRYQAGREFMRSRADWYRQQGYSVLLYDARATGESEGMRISLGYHEVHDLLAALTWVRRQGATRMVLHGVSQGGATILMAAERLGDEVIGVVAESTYDTLAHAGDRRFRNKVKLPGWLAGFFYRPLVELQMDLRVRDVQPIAHIAALPCPVFILSGAEDRHTWATDTERLFAAARPPKQLWLVPGAAHVDLYAFEPAEFEKRLSAFLSDL